MTTLEGGAGLFLFDVEASGAAVMLRFFRAACALERREKKATMVCKGDVDELITTRWSTECASNKNSLGGYRGTRDFRGLNFTWPSHSPLYAYSICSRYQSTAGAERRRGQQQTSQ